MKTFQPIHSKNFLFVLFYGPLESWARIFKLLRTPGIDSTESIPVRNQFCYEIYSWRQRFHVKELKVSELSSSYVVCGRRHSYGQHIFNPQTIWQLWAGVEKSISALKIKFFGICSTRFHAWFLLNSRWRFFSHITFKIPALEYKLRSVLLLRVTTNSV